MEQPLEQFRNWLEVNGFALATRNDYTQRVRDFLKIHPDNFSEEIINAYFLDLKSKMSPSTVNCYRSAILKYFEFEKINITLPKLLKCPHLLPDSISEDYFENRIIPMVDMIFQKPEKVTAILYMMFYTGLRRVEVTLLKRENFNFESREVKVFIKKRQLEKIVVIPKRAVGTIKNYFLIEEERKGAFNITVPGVNDIFMKLKPNFKDIKLRPHLLRHSFATHCLKKGINLGVVSKMLGHSSVQSTMRYLDIDVDLIKSEIDEKF